MALRLLRRVCFSLLLLFIGTELALQAAHLIHEALHPEPALARPDAPVILCVGDSHTYGVKVPPEDSYPGQLQALFDKNGYQVNVVNAGVPGQNTSELRRGLPDLLGRYRPRIVVILICANNDWNLHDMAWSDLQDGVIGHGPQAWLIQTRQALAALRTVRLVTYVWNETGRRLHPNERVVDRRGNVYFHDWRGKDMSDPRKLDRITRDIWNIIGTAEGSGARPILLTYAGKPESPMILANQVIRHSARTLGVELVDVDRAIEPMITLADGGLDMESRNRLFLAEPGETHLAAPGYAVAAQMLFESIEGLDVLEKPSATAPPDR